MAKVGGKTAAARPRIVPLPGLRVGQWLSDLGQAGASSWRDNALGMAGMIAFFGFLAVIPLVVLLLTFIGTVLGGIIPAHDVRTIFNLAVPGLSQKQFLTVYWNPVRHAKASTTILGILSMLLGTLGLHDSVDWAVNQIWRSAQPRRFWVAKVRGLAVTLWAMCYVVGSVVLTWVTAELLGLVHAPHLIFSGLGPFLPLFFLDVAIFGLLYKFTPTVEVDTRSAVIAGTLGAALWQVSKLVFGWWVLQVGTYNRVYGPLAASVIVMLWLWISGIIFLYGAELAAILQRNHFSSSLHEL